MKKRLLERLAAVKELKAVAALYKKRKGCVLRKHWYFWCPDEKR